MKRVLIPYMQVFTDYLRAMFEEKRKKPKDDLISALVRVEESGDKLSEDELLAMVFLLLIGGQETPLTSSETACWRCCNTPTNSKN